MNRLITAGASAVILWLPFALACTLAVPVGITGLALWATTGSDALYRYTKNLLGGMDRAGSGLLGADARYTISAHCGVGRWPLLRRLLDLIAPGHTEGAARNEGLR